MHSCMAKIWFALHGFHSPFHRFGSAADFPLPEFSLSQWAREQSMPGTITCGRSRGRRGEGGGCAATKSGFLNWHAAQRGKCYLMHARKTMYCSFTGMDRRCFPGISAVASSQTKFAWRGFLVFSPKAKLFSSALSTQLTGFSFR